MEVSMDQSLSRQSIRPRGFGLVSKLITWLHARADGPKHRKGSLPLGTLEPEIARIFHEVEKRNQRLASLATHFLHRIAHAIGQALAALARPLDELPTRKRVLDEAIERYKSDHDGMEPPEHGAPFTQLASFWGFGILFTLGELPLMSAALERLPLPDWQRFMAAAGASAVVIYMAHEIGVWFAKPGKTLSQVCFGWVLVLVLSCILTFAAIVRRDSIREHEKSPVSPAPQVFIRQPKGGHAFHV
jgi:hypothetical protein